MSDDSDAQTTRSDVLNSPLGQAYQRACNELVNAKHRSDPVAAERFFAAAKAIEDAFATEIAAYRAALGVADA